MLVRKTNCGNTNCSKPGPTSPSAVAFVYITFAVGNSASLSIMQFYESSGEVYDRGPRCSDTIHFESTGNSSRHLNAK
jgi:hypothetical protein